VAEQPFSQVCVVGARTEENRRWEFCVMIFDSYECPWFAGRNRKLLVEVGRRRRENLRRAKKRSGCLANFGLSIFCELTSSMV